MDIFEIEEVHERGTIAPSMVIAVAVKKGGNSTFALLWALYKFMFPGQTLILLHVRPRLLSIPTPMGRIPISQIQEDAVAAYMQEVDLETHAIFSPYLQLCRVKKVETVLAVAEEDDVACGIIRLISSYCISKLVIGSSSRNAIQRRFKGLDLPATVAKNAPNFCTVYVISKGKLLSVRSATSTDFKIGNAEDISDCSSPTTGGAESESGASIPSYSQSPRFQRNQSLSGVNQFMRSNSISNPASTTTYVEGHRSVTVAAQEKAESQAAMRQAETARQLAEKEAEQRRDAELRATIESEERKKAQQAPAFTHQGYRKYSIEEIQSATDFLSDSLKIGEGGYGAVYMCNLQHTTVAIKVLRNETTHGIQQFQREIEVLSQIRHPHLVLLLGACHELGCLVYEYMANGNLEDRLLCKGNTAPLPWFSRFRIIWEVASALLFLHSAKPEPIVHRDLKPANILLDRNFVSKIGDAGLARLVPAKATTMETQFNDTVPAGTFFYIDPEYLRTGSLGPKSDLYALGITILQLLTAKPPMAVTDAVETAIENGTFQQILDKNAGDWPPEEAMDLAILGLKCSEFRYRDRPDLEKEVLPELERFKALADAQTGHDTEKIDIMPPSHFFCPILQEVMEDPHVAADGFTYEYSTIKTWFENSNTSPMTNMSLKHRNLIPNHPLRSAILEWKIRSGLTNSSL